MRPFLFLFIFSLFFLENYGQVNLVINGDLENFKKEKFTGPQVFAASDSQMVVMSLREGGIVYLVPDWTIPGVSTPDFFESDSCRGKACVGIFTTHRDQYREFIQFSLSEMLITDSLYKISFYLRPFNKHITVTHQFDPVSMGFLFDNDRRGKNDLRFPVLNKPPHFIPLPRLNENDWTKIEFNYQAKGGEKYITAGNFLHDDQIPGLLDTIPDERIGYIVLDDFSVSPLFFMPAIPEEEFIIINYEKDQSDISVEWREILEEKIKVAHKDCVEKSIKIKAYSSEEGNRTYNYKLSGQRAEKIKEYFISKGYPESSLEIEYFGEENCAGDCRKAEIQFICR